MSKHPLQPLEIAKDGVLRFKCNAIVNYLLSVASEHGADLNALARMDSFSQDDWQQLRQLIGYSHDGIPNIDEESWQAAEAIYKAGTSEVEARYNRVRDELAALRKALRKPMAQLFGVHPDDLKDQP